MTCAKKACAAQKDQIKLFHTAGRREYIGADPVMGDATEIACLASADSTRVTLVEDEAFAGDGADEPHRRSFYLWLLSAIGIVAAWWFPIPT
jgi:hypothetical protein